MPNNYRGGSMGPGYMTNDKPSLGFTVNEKHRAAFGHFTQERFLRDGHNTMTKSVGGLQESSGKVAVQKRGGTVRTRAAKLLSNRTARKAFKAGGAVGAAVAKARPVLAAKVAAKAFGVTGKARRQAVRQARQVKRKGVGYTSTTSA